MAGLLTAYPNLTGSDKRTVALSTRSKVPHAHTDVSVIVAGRRRDGVWSF